MLWPTRANASSEDLVFRLSLLKNVLIIYETPPKASHDPIISLHPI